MENYLKRMSKLQKEFADIYKDEKSGLVAIYDNSVHMMVAEFLLNFDDFTRIDRRPAYKGNRLVAEYGGVEFFCLDETGEF